MRSKNKKLTLVLTLSIIANINIICSAEININKFKTCTEIKDCYDAHNIYSDIKYLHSIRTPKEVG